MLLFIRNIQDALKLRENLEYELSKQGLSLRESRPDDTSAMLELCHACNVSEGLDPFGNFFENFVTKPSSKSLVVIDKSHHVVSACTLQKLLWYSALHIIIIAMIIYFCFWPLRYYLTHVTSSTIFWIWKSSDLTVLPKYIILTWNSNPSSSWITTWHTSKRLQGPRGVCRLRTAAQYCTAAGTSYYSLGPELIQNGAVDGCSRARSSRSRSTLWLSPEANRLSTSRGSIVIARAGRSTTSSALHVSTAALCYNRRAPKEVLALRATTSKLAPLKWSMLMYVRYVILSVW